MNKVKPKTVGIIGLAVSSFGALISALSFAAGDGRQESLISGIEYHIALVSGYGFRIGIFLLILGFLFQIVEKINDENIKIDFLVGIFLVSVLAYFVFINLVSEILFL